MTRARAVFASEAGAAAVEFAFILPILLLFALGTIESAIVLFIRSSIESAVLEASRYGITGSEDGVSRADRVLAIVEERTYGLLDPDKIELETLVYDDFADIGKPEPFVDANGSGFYELGESFTDVNGNGKWDADMGKAGLGDGNDIVVYRVRYSWGIITPMLRGIVGESIVNESAVAVRNEPYK
ncbi:MAG: pilus assembly protein [Amaricoccus sp.]|uniref:TadE/TadG family type IV pilus assembly protein n=1 Tax=Amaricoccus sp. TaxID=1872485 RepID=UPI0039E584F2